MNLMEFKIAVIGTRMFGDLGLIANDIPVQDEKGFQDPKLKALIEGGSNESLAQPITVKGGSNIQFSSLKDLAEEYLMVLATAHEVVA